MLISSYQSGVSGSGSAYFGRLMRRFIRENVPLRYLAEDLCGEKDVIQPKVVSLLPLFSKFVVKKRQPKR